MPDRNRTSNRNKKNSKGKPGDVKDRLHPRNKNRTRYDFEKLIDSNPDLAEYVKLNPRNEKTIDFANPEAVKALNKSILQSDYGLTFWDIPEGYLCPPIPGRADYIHHIADVLCENNFGKIPTGKKITCLDIGVGANCIYPIIGNSEYGWSFIGTEIDSTALESAMKIAISNVNLKEHVECRLQEKSNDILKGVLKPDELVDFTVCNPPFHSSAAEAAEGSRRKVRNLGNLKGNTVKLNFGGQSNELWCEGGEKAFIRKMIHESKTKGSSCFWFSTLVSKQAHLKGIYEILKKVDAVKVKTIPMGQGNKASRIVAWTFLPPDEQKNWKITRWKV